MNFSSLRLKLEDSAAAIAVIIIIAGGGGGGLHAKLSGKLMQQWNSMAQGGRDGENEGGKGLVLMDTVLFKILFICTITLGNA